MNIRVLTAASLALLFASATHAANCVIVVVGGAQTSPAPKSKEPRDIATDVIMHTFRQAKRTDCEVVSGTNQTPGEFESMLARAAKLRKDDKTQFHFTFTDHGTQNFIYLKESVFYPYAKFEEVLRANFPKGTNLSYSSSNCYGDLSNFVLNRDVDEHFNICGGESTFPGRLSLNLRAYKESFGKVTGAYTAGMIHALEKGESLSQGHQSAMRGDAGNLSRVPGLLTSQALVYKELLKSGYLTRDDLPSTAPDLLNFWAKTAKGSRFPLIAGLQNIFERQMQASDCGEVCYYSQMLNLAPLEAAQQIPIDIELAQYRRVLPPARFLELKASVDWLLRHRKRYADKLSGNLERATKAQGNAATFDAMENPDFYFHLNRVMSAPALKLFMEKAKPEARARYNRFVRCEAGARF